MVNISESSQQKFTKDVLFIGAANLLVALTGLVMMPLFTKYMGAHDYGLWVQVMVTTGLAVSLIDLGLPAAMNRFLPAKKDRSEIQEGFYSVLCVTLLTSLIFTLVIILSAEFIAEAFFDGATEVVRITGLLILVMVPVGVCLGLLRALGQMKKYAVFTILSSYGQVALIAVLVLNGYGLSAIVFGVLAIRVIELFILLVMISRQIGVRIPHFPMIKEYLSFGLPIIPGAISLWLIATSDRYVIAYFLGASSVGIYSAGYRLGGILSLVVIAIALVLPPTLSRLYDEGKIDEVKTQISFSLKYFLVLAVPFVFGASMLSKQVLMVFSTPAIASEGYFVVPFVALSTLFYGVAIIMGQSLRLVKKTRILAGTWIVAGLANLSLNILLVPHIEILAAAITTLIAYSIALGIITYSSMKEKELRFSIEWGFILKSVIASAIMSLLIWMADPDRVLSIIATVITSIIIYVVILLSLKSFTGEDIKFFKGLYHRSF